MSEGIKNNILVLIASRAPNWVRSEIIIRRISKYNDKDVKTAIDELVSESKLEKISPSCDAYRLKSYENIPVNRDIKIGKTSIPRILETELVEVSLEDINEQI